MPDAPQSALELALAVARRWRQANGHPADAGVVLVLDGQFVGFLEQIPSPTNWAPGCLAVAADDRVHLARPAGFRGEIEWAELGVFAPEEQSGAPAAALQPPKENGSLDP